MTLYCSIKSVPELQDLAPANRRRVWQAAWRVAGGMSLGEIVVLGLAIAVGANLGPLGIGLCIGIVSLPIFSRIAHRLRPTILTVRRELGLGVPSYGQDSAL